MAAMVEVKCEWCGKKFRARVADRKRGWGRFCGKTCKAKEQESRTGANAKFQREGRLRLYKLVTYGHPFASGDEGHGQE